MCGYFERHLQLRGVRHGLQRTREWEIGLCRRKLRLSMYGSLHPLRQQLRRHQDGHRQLRWLRYGLSRDYQWHCHLFRQRMWDRVRFRLLALLGRLRENSHRQQQLWWLRDHLQGKQAMRRWELHEVAG